MITELQTRYDSRQSFYGKALTETYDKEDTLHIDLLSYGTLVANYVKYRKDNKEIFEHFGTFSQTTTRHQKEFYKQLGLNDEEIKELIKNGRLEKWKKYL